MLTAELGRRKLTPTTVEPATIDVERYRELAERLIHLFREHVGRKREELEGAVEELTLDTDYKIVQGLAKLLQDRCDFQVASPLEPERIRAALFAEAAPKYPIVKTPSLVHTTQADQVYRAVAERLGVAPEAVRAGMYADLEGNHRLTRFHEMDPRDLLERYNLALAQVLLYDAGELRIRVFDHYSTVFGYMKLFRLMHEIRPLPEGYEVRLDGPASLFYLTRKYGIRMADFLPALALCDRWWMEARIVVGEDPPATRTLTLTEACGLKSHYQARRRFDSELERTLAGKFERAKTEWELRREDTVIDLGESVMIPDFSLVHPDGRRALLEIVGFWTPQYLGKKVEKVRRARAQGLPLLLAVSEKLNCAHEDFKWGEQVLFFKTGIHVYEMVELAERYAIKDRVS